MGNPFLYPINVDDLQVTAGGLGIQLTSVLNLLTERTVKIWNGTAYVDASVINGRTAFWVRKLSPGNVDLIVRPIASTSGSPAPTLATPPGASWAVALQISQGDRVAERVMLGAAAVRTGEWNPLSASRAPSPPTGQHLVAFVEKTDWGRMNGQYVREFKAPAASMEWEFIVEGASAPGEIQLEVQGHSLPADRTLWLTEIASQETREVLPGARLSYPARAGRHVFRLVVAGSGSEPAASPLVEQLRFAYPNPFVQSVGIALTLATRGDVRIDVYDLQGRRVRSMERTGLDPGDHVVVWDGRDASGRIVPEGVYLTRYKVGSVTGTARIVKMP
jgi:hypothetical protein